MASRYQIGGWPARFNIKGNVAQVHAIGQITLAYNWLEESIALTFQSCMPTDKDYSERLFHKLGNRDRIDMMSAVIKASRFHPEAKGHLNYLLQCYDICTDNRNILAHAAFREAYAGVLHVVKRSSNNPTIENRFRIPLADLRAVAEAMHALYSYAIELFMWLEVRKAFPAKYRNSLKLPPLDTISAPTLRRVLKAVPEFGTRLPEWPAPGSEDTEFGVLMELEVRHGEAEVYA